MNIADLPDDSETSDEDYEPEKAVAEVLSEEESDGEEEDDLPFNEEIGKRTKRQKKGNRKKKCKDDSRNSPNEQAQNTKELDKKVTDSLWADFMKDTGFKTRAERQNVSVPSPSIINKTLNVSSTKPEAVQKVKVTEIYNFAGEEVKVEKEVNVKDANVKTPTSGSVIGKKSSGSKLNSLLSQMGKSRKITTLEKTKLDWDKFKKDENIEDELQAYGKSKDGYLERQDFLERADQRRFEIEKDIRNNVRSNKINNVNL